MQRKPEWLRQKLRATPHGGKLSHAHAMKEKLRSHSLNTVCESAKCPNLHECFERKTATFMIMGNTCTRNCGFCAVGHGETGPLDPDEPRQVAQMVKELGLRHVVITSVTRDDLPDGGAAHFAAVIEAASTSFARRGLIIELLTPDFNGNEKSIKTVLDAGPDIFNHNLETVERLTPEVRSRASYAGSLKVLKYAAEYAKTDLHLRGGGRLIVKSGLMLGLGEEEEEIKATLEDLAGAGCDIVTIGQYLRPSGAHLPVKRYLEPDVFRRYKAYGERIGIKRVFAGPLIRSSYMAEEVFKALGPGSKY